MTTYPDLSRYSYSRKRNSWRNIGWLGAEKPFPTGPVDASVVATLLRLAVDPVNLMRGFHDCEFCDVESPIVVDVPDAGEALLGNGEIKVSSDGAPTYVAPTLIVHYIEAHGYRPPDEFLDAVRAT